MKRDEKNAQGVTTLGAPRETGKFAEMESSADVADCQATPGDWFTANSAMIIPKQCAGFLWNTEEPGLWIPISNKARSLAYIVNGYDVKKPYRGFCRAMFITSTGSDNIPQKAADEEKDPEVNSVHRWGHLCFDLDDKKDRDHALADLQTLIERLFDLDVKPQQLSIFWSGGKGFHLVVYDTLIGSTDGHKFLSRIYKAMALEIAGDLRTLDTSIYNKGYGKQFRLPNVKRQNGQHKIPLNIEEVLKGTALTIEQFEELAKEPRFIPLPPLSTTTEDAPIRALYARKKAEIEAMPKQAVSSIVWGDEERETLRENVWPCIAAFTKQHGYYGESNLDGYAYRIIKPFCQETGTPDSEAMTLFGPVIVSMESETYTDDESKLRHVEQELKRPSDQRWSCADARRFIDPSTFSCDGCPRQALIDERSSLEASKMFTDSIYDFSTIDKRADEELKREGEGLTKDQGEAHEKKAFSFDKYRLANYLATKPKPIRWILNNSFKIGTLGFLAGPQGGGKTHFLTQLAAAVASGDSRFIGGVFDIAEKGEVLYVSAEDDYDTIQDRVWRLFDSTIVNPFDSSCKLPNVVEQDLRHNLIVYPVFGSPVTFTQKSEGNVMFTGHFVSFLTLVKKLTNLKLIILDPLSRFNGCDENDNHASTVLCSLLEEIIMETGASVLVAHHVGKGFSQVASGSFDLDKALHMDALRGASGLSGAARWQMNFVPLPHKAARQELKCTSAIDGQYIACKVSKNNHAPLTKPFFLHRGAGGLLEPANVEYEAGGGGALGDLLRAKILEEVRRISEAGEPPITKKTLGDTRPAMWKAEIPKATKTRVLAEVEELLRLGELAEVEMLGRNNRPNLYLAIQGNTGQA